MKTSVSINELLSILGRQIDKEPPSEIRNARVAEIRNLAMAATLESEPDEDAKCMVEDARKRLIELIANPFSAGKSGEILEANELKRFYDPDRD